MEWCKKPFIEYLNAVDDELTIRYGISSNDTNMDMIASCHECDETPEECVRQIGETYDLTQISLDS